MMGIRKILMPVLIFNIVLTLNVFADEVSDALVRCRDEGGQLIQDQLVLTNRVHNLVEKSSVTREQQMLEP